MDEIAKQHVDVVDDLQQMLAMNPNLTLDEINAVAAKHMQERNSRPVTDFYTEIAGISAA